MINTKICPPIKRIPDDEPSCYVKQCCSTDNIAFIYIYINIYVFYLSKGGYGTYDCFNTTALSSGSLPVLDGQITRKH